MRNESASDQSSDVTRRRLGPTEVTASDIGVKGGRSIPSAKTKYKERFASPNPPSGGAAMSDDLLKELGSNLPSPWTVHFHASKKKIYYKNDETGEMQWTDPTETTSAAPKDGKEDGPKLGSKSPHTKSALRNDKDLLELSEPELGSLCVEILTGFVVGAMVGVKPVKGFVADVMATWALKSPPFHNFAHATDTLTTMTRLLHPNYCDAQRFLYPPEAWALGLAALGHDLAHPGLDNAHQVRIGSELATRYSDVKPLEANSSAITLKLIKKHGLFDPLDVEDERRSRMIIITTIMSSEWGSHTDVIDKFQIFAENNASFLGIVPDDEERQVLCCMLLHAADVSKLSRMWEVAQKWAELLAEEFMQQGDLETQLGIPTPPHMNRRLATSNSLALNTIDNFVAPTLSLLSTFLPRASDMVKTAENNRARFSQLFGEGPGDALIEQQERASVDVGKGPGKQAQRNTAAAFQSVMMPEDGAGAASLSKAGGGISDKMAAANQDDNLKLEESMSQRRTTTDVINEFKISIEKLINSNLWQGVSFLMTIIALFLVGIRDAFFEKGSDRAVVMLLFITLCFFLVEMILMSFAIKGYACSFFFWLDLAGTVSLVFDVPWLMAAIADSLGEGGKSALDFARAGRAARAGARATRLARLTRLLRLIRFVRLLKFFAKLGRKKNGRAGQSNDETPSRVGEMLAEQISRRVVILVLLVVLVTPFLEVGIDYYTPNENLMLSMEKMQVSERELFIDEVIRKKETPVVYLVVLGKVYQEKPDDRKDVFRLGELERFRAPDASTKAGCTPSPPRNDCATLVWYDNREQFKLQGLFSLSLIFFMVFLLSFGSWLFTQIAKRLVVGPIERMLKVVDIVSISLQSLASDGNAKEDKTGDEEATFETSFLEEAVLKMAELLNMGYGAAGAEIIQRNLGLSDGNAVETFVAGRKMFAVFAFCDIRKFTNATEILQENVLRFVNLIGHIVHSNTVFFSGAPNKNIGDAFLLVWKVRTKEGTMFDLSVEAEDTTDSLFPGFKATKDMSPVSNIADAALKAMVQTAYDLDHLNSLPTWELQSQMLSLDILPAEEGQGSEEAALNEGDYSQLEDLIDSLIMAGRNINMGYGLHYGWAIEGAIGSSMKIDASYLSPHVNTAARLEAATKQYKQQFLMSGAFVVRLSGANRQLCRKLDSVVLVGQTIPTKLFTWDFWIGKSREECHHSLSSLSKLPNAVTPYEYCRLFEEGEQAYEDGNWPLATSRLLECQKMLQLDYGARVLIGVMSKYNFNSPMDWQGSRVLTEK